jgi:hypothetical protein
VTSTCWSTIRSLTEHSPIRSPIATGAAGMPGQLAG